MDTIARCSRCVLPRSLPSAAVDGEGVCRHCRDFERAFGNWQAVKDARRQAFEAHVERARRLHREYDCLVPLSGGKDSTFALYVCARVYGLRCLCVTLDNGFLAEHARENIRNALRAANADHLFYQINRRTLLGLYALFLRKCGNFCPVCMRGIAVCTQMPVARFRIPLIVSGDGRRITYAAFVREVFEAGDRGFFRAVLENEPLAGQAGPLLANPYSWTWRNLPRFAGELLRLPGARTPFLPVWDYLDGPAADLPDLLRSEMGWEPRSGDEEHSDCLLHPIVPYIHRAKFPELTPTTLKNAALVRWGTLPREEALRIEDEGLRTAPEPPPVLEPFLAEIRMSRDEFESSIRDWRRLARFRGRRGFLRRAYRRLAGIDPRG